MWKNERAAGWGSCQVGDGAGHVTVKSKRYVLKGLVSSGHKRSSLSAPASGGLHGAAGLDQDEAAHHQFAFGRCAFFSSFPFFLSLFPGTVAKPAANANYCSSVTPVNHTRAPRTDSFQDSFCHPVTQLKQNNTTIRISHNDENYFCVTAVPHTQITYIKFVYKTVITKQRVIFFLPP